MKWKLTPKAREIYKLGGSFEIPEDREDLQELADQLADTDGFGYAFFYGGGINPDAIIEDQDQLEELETAIKLVQSFERVYSTIATET